MVSTAVPARASSSDDPLLTTSCTNVPTLPAEIHQFIVAACVDPDPLFTSLTPRYEILCRLSLVCKSWNALVLPLLYRDVLLETEAQAATFYDSVQQAEEGRDSSLARRVETLRLGAIPWLGKTYREMADDQDEEEEIEEHYLSTGEAKDFFLEELLQAMSGLKELWMAGIRHVPLSALRWAQNLEALHMLRSSICDCDVFPAVLSDPPLTFPHLRRLEVYARCITMSTSRVFFSSSTFPSLERFSFACPSADFPSTTLDISHLTGLSTITDAPPSIAKSNLLLLDMYQIPLRPALPHLPKSLLILRLNDYSPLTLSVPWLLVDHETSDQLASRLPNLRELWLPQSYCDWRDDSKESVREMVKVWVDNWEKRGVTVVFEGEDERNRHLEPEQRILTEESAFDFQFERLCSRVERLAAGGTGT
ncbi:Serine/arginine repetitive matrix protein 2 [Rhodotorula toruloides ATCC 204091]|uniref:BY PROTMAP: gi/342319037/gb/EGU10989.1/ Serine/arginine repetitive matrix protein 2 [Rhodotorula glutinis ATCC 204091] n=2 Tax=Rhodotorula toruloides TaxID=5286 RepID=A0A0K3CPN2_RHOTO|nr:Serine/arginine repetitive matrix protein 2 [Rhodotorula toruloides ATCC 204091]KAK4330737.1 Serine/arginine repetitive matrix protein 2 [Rhodotorula toruloides]